MILIFLFIIFMGWLAIMSLGAVLGFFGGIIYKLLGVFGYNSWWERMKIERSPENMAKRAAQRQETAHSDKTDSSKS